MRLAAWVGGLPEPDAVSRLVIEPGPGRCRITATLQAWAKSPQLNGETLEPVPSKPVSVDNKEGLGALRPPVTLQITERAPDVVGWIDSAELPEQISELAASGLVGGINTERLGARKLVLSTHSGSQAERSAWVNARARG